MSYIIKVVIFFVIFTFALPLFFGHGKPNCIPSWKYSYENADEKLVIQTEKAIWSWEKILNNKELFIYDENSKNIIGYGQLKEENAGTTDMSINSYGFMGDFSIKISDTLEKEYIYRTMLHELAHSMGVRHTKQKETILFLSMTETDFITEIDREAVLRSFEDCTTTFPS